MSGNVQSERDDAKAQARFVRAYIYYKLIERYGPVPIMPEEGLDVEKPYDELGTPRNTMDECVDFCAMNCLRLPPHCPKHVIRAI